MVATSAPDGCTLGLVYAAIASNPSLFKKLPYDTLKDLAMVSQLVDLPIGLFALPSLPANNLAELVAYAKTRPEGLTYGSPGVGSASHLAGTMLASMTSANLIHIPYKGAAAAELDLVAGRISLMFAAAPTEVGFLKAGKLKLIAVAGDRRFPTYPEVPTIGESIPGFTMNSYFGVVASGRIPRPAVEQLSRDIASAMANPEVKARVEGLHLTVVGSTPEAFEKLVRTDIEAMAKVIKANGIEAQ
jgi:tripartite-type tricarboxylate transporter receptor subunit TctC